MRRKRRRRAATWSIPLETTLYSMFHNVLRRSWSSLLVVTASTSEFVSETRTRRALDTGARFHEESEEASYSSSSSRRRWNCRLVAQDQSFDFIQEPSNINRRRLESDCCLRVGIPSTDAILVPVLPDVVPALPLVSCIANYKNWLFSWNSLKRDRFTLRTCTSVYLSQLSFCWKEGNEV